ncbi:MAG: sigma-54-dependent Fis family transcriptional regulator [Thermoguttaceae bacterium]|nr:sigma-54-dependent Fis family transcriptional regulator [Thermoguttaceae bacterium]
MSKRKSLPLILIIESEENEVLTISHALANEEAAFAAVDAQENIKNAIEQAPPQVVIFSVDGLSSDQQSDIISFAKQINPNVIVIVTSRSADPVKIVESMRLGAFDYLVKPLEPARLANSITQALRQLKSLAPPRSIDTVPTDRKRLPDAFASFVGESILTLSILKKASVYAQQAFPVFLQGETGTGKRLLSQLIHKASGRSGDYVYISLEGLDDDAFYREFYGAIPRCKSGTLYIADISKTTLRQQRLILQWFQEQKIYFPVNLNIPDLQIEEVRLICGAVTPLEELLSVGAFDQNLYYALTANSIRLSPLRENLEDIPVLLDYFLEVSAKKQGKRVPSYPKELVTLLKSYSFPGNALELSTLAENAMSYYEKGMLSQSAFQEIIDARRDKTPQILPEYMSLSEALSKCEPLPSFKVARELYIQEVLRRTENNQSAAAKILGITRQAVNSYLSVHPEANPDNDENKSEN